MFVYFLHYKEGLLAIELLHQWSGYLRSDVLSKATDLAKFGKRRVNLNCWRVPLFPGMMNILLSWHRCSPWTVWLWPPVTIIPKQLDWNVSHVNRTIGRRLAVGSDKRLNSILALITCSEWQQAGLITQTVSNQQNAGILVNLVCCQWKPGKKTCLALNIS